jgi:hypothetical protein
VTSSLIQTALTNSGSDLIYDDFLNITWIQAAILCRWFLDGETGELFSFQIAVFAMGIIG